MKGDGIRALRAAAMPAEIVEDARIVRLSLGARRGGDPWRIQVARPACPPPPEGYPALYLLDGDATFPAAWRALAGRPGACLALVAVGYPGGRRIDIARRYYDLTPPTPAEYLRSRDAGLRTGGREAFLDFLAGPLRAEASRILPLDPNRAALFGHSLGGLFALHALMARPAQFQSYAAADPSIWWDGHSILQEADAFLGGIAAAGGALARPIRLHVATSASPPPVACGCTRYAAMGGPSPGTPSQDEAIDGPMPAGLTPDGPPQGSPAFGLARALARVAGFEVLYKHHAGESHGSLIEPASTDAALFACGLAPQGAQRLPTG